MSVGPIYPPAAAGVSHRAGGLGSIPEGAAGLAGGQGCKYDPHEISKLPSTISEIAKCLPL